MPVFGLAIWAIVLFAFAASGVFVVRSGVRAMARARRLGEVGRQAIGTVTDNQMRSHTGTSNSGGYVTFHPVIRYTTENQAEVVAIGPVGSRVSFLAGTTVPIRYDPDNPDRVEITSGPGSGSGGGGCGIAIGIFLLLVAVAGTVGAIAIARQLSE